VAIAQPASRRRSVLLLLVVTAITLVTLDLREGTSGPVAAIRSWSRDSVAPVQDAVGSATKPVGDWFDGVFHAGEIKRENERLRQDLAESRNDAARGRSAIRENEQLTGLLNLSNVANVPTVAARVVANSVGNFDDSVELDRGTDSGVKVGMPVVVGQGLVGRVVQASGQRSTVLLVTDSGSGVGVRLESSDAVGVAKGKTGSKNMSLDFVRSDADVNKGEIVTTSGVDGARFPSGIPVARVVDVTRTPGEAAPRIALEPLADLSRLEIVKILVWQPPAGG